MNTCYICRVKKKHRFSTQRVIICRGCIDFLLNKPVDPKLLDDSLKEVIERNFPIPTKEYIKEDAKTTFSKRHGIIKNLIYKILDTEKYNLELDKFIEFEYKKSLSKQFKSEK